MSTLHELQELSVGELIEFDVDNADVLKRLSIDVYDGITAGYREPITNATTAVREAIEQDYITPDEGLVEVSIDEAEETLVITDNGIGMTEHRIRDIVTRIGASTQRDTVDNTGRFGMGFLATFLLTGFDGGFKMTTRSRETGEIVTGYWTNRGFHKIESSNEKLTYGTRFEIPLTVEIGDPIRFESLYSEIQDYLKYARVPTTLIQYGSNGSVRADDEWTADELGGKETVTLENQFVEVAVSSSGIGCDMVLLDAPIDSGVSIDSTGECTVRLKQEESVVVEGSHKGRFVRTNPPEGTEYLTPSELDEDDVRTPTPVGTRDTLENVTDEFVEWLDRQVSERMRTILGDEDLPYEKRVTAFRHLYKYGETPFDGDVDTEFAEELVSELFSIPSYYNFETGEWVDEDDPELTGDVYMAAKPDRRKLYSLWEQGDTVVMIDSNRSMSDCYSRLNDLLGWSRLTNYEADHEPTTATLYVDSGRTNKVTVHVPTIQEKMKYNKTIVVNEDAPTRLRDFPEIVETSDESARQLESAYTLQEYAKMRVDDELLNAETVYYGGDYPIGKGVYREELGYKNKRLLRLYGDIELVHVSGDTIAERLRSHVDHDRLRTLLSDVSFDEMDEDEVIELFNILSDEF